MTGLYWDEDDNQEGLLTRRSPRHCLSGQEVEDFLFQRLSGVSREAVEEHLLFCEACRSRVEAEERLIDAFRGASERMIAESVSADLAAPPASRSPSRFSPPRWAMAAVLALLLLGGGLTLKLLRAPGTVEVSLVARRSADESAEVQPVEGRRLSFHADVRGLPPLPSFRWLVVDAYGTMMASGAADREAEAIRFQLPRGLPAGRYWVRIYDSESGVLLREFGLSVRPKG